MFFAKSKGETLGAIMGSLSFADYVESFQTLKFDDLDEYFKSKFEAGTDLPKTVNLGGRQPLTIHYSLSEDPYVEAPIQDFYGQSFLPGLLGGKFPLTIKLLGPHKRPIQVTKDLKGFWEKTYKELKKEYQREYPRHHWPDDPLKAPPILLKRQLPNK
jgi:ATP-dependent helicase HrpB